MPQFWLFENYISRVAKKLRVCGYTTREEGLPYVRSLKKVSTFNQQISAKSAGTRNKKLILNDITSIIFEEDLKT